MKQILIWSAHKMICMCIDNLPNVWPSSNLQLWEVYCEVALNYNVYFSGAYVYAYIDTHITDAYMYVI